MLTEVKDIYAIHIIIYYIDGGKMEREGRRGREGEYGRVEMGRRKMQGWIMARMGATYRGMDMEGAWSGDGWGKGYQ